MAERWSPARVVSTRCNRLQQAATGCVEAADNIGINYMRWANQKLSAGGQILNRILIALGAKQYRNRILTFRSFLTFFLRLLEQVLRWTFAPNELRCPQCRRLVLLVVFVLCFKYNIIIMLIIIICIPLLLVLTSSY